MAEIEATGALSFTAIDEKTGGQRRMVGRYAARKPVAAAVLGLYLTMRVCDANGRDTGEKRGAAVANKAGH